MKIDDPKADECQHFELDMANCFAGGTLLNFSLLHVLHEVTQRASAQGHHLRCNVCFVAGTAVMALLAVWA